MLAIARAAASIQPSQFTAPGFAISTFAIAANRFRANGI
jgi:hypothetical protein